MEYFILLVFIIILLIIAIITISLVINNQNKSQIDILPVIPEPPISLNRQPMVVIPGLAGTNLDFTIDDNFNVPVCDNQEINKLIEIQPSLWANILGFISQKPCFLRMLKPVYDPIGKTLKNLDGLKTSVHGSYFGDPLSAICIAYVLKSILCYPETDYSRNFVDFFTKVGYQSGEDLFITGYDFRLVPYEPYLSIYFSELQKLIENTYISTRQKINLVGHSLGTSLANIFLNKMDSDWKDKYIEKFISISPAYDGAPKSLRTVISGFNFGFPDIIRITDRDIQDTERTLAGLMNEIPLLPEMYGQVNSQSEGNGDAVILIRDGVSRLYNVNNYSDGIIGLIRDVANESGEEDLNLTADILSDIANERISYGYTDPGVRVYQMAVQPIATESGPYAYDLSRNGFNADPLNNVTVPGDETVPLYGSLIPDVYGWKDITKKVFTPTDGLNHYTLFQDSEVAYQYILTLVTS